MLLLTLALACGTNDGTSPDDTGALDSFDSGEGTDTSGDTHEDTDSGGSDDADADGYSVADGDCDDGNAAVNPGATEVCNNGVDDDCDGGAGDCGLTGDIDINAAQGLATGASQSDYFGVAIDAVDQDGDGRDELVVGALLNNEGAFYVLGDLGPGTVSATSAIASMEGDPASILGSELTALGDEDGDGMGDFLVAAPTSATAGAVYLFHGPVTGALTASDAAGVWTGETDADTLGTDVDAGDLDGDGLTDFVVGAARSTSMSTRGAVFVFLDGASGVHPATSADGRWYGHTSRNIGESVAIAPDLDGDGFDDLLVGSSWQDTSDSAVWVLSGPADDAGYIDDAAVAWFQTGSSFAGPGTQRNTMCGLGDVSGDGYGDIAVGDPGGVGYPPAGAVYVLDGRLSGAQDFTFADATITGDTSDQWFGGVVKPAGDTNADGVPELFVMDATDTMSVVPLDISGTETVSAVRTVAFHGVEYNDNLRAATTGDFDGDGRVDIALGAAGYDAGASDAGGVLLFFGNGL